jgi:hypothetical protein
LRIVSANGAFFILRENRAIERTKSDVPENRARAANFDCAALRALLLNCEIKFQGLTDLQRSASQSFCVVAFRVESSKHKTAQTAAWSALAHSIECSAHRTFERMS